jgi:hypothetical protein
MSRKSKEKDRRAERSAAHYWKMVDDRSGFYMYSNEAVMDHRGRVTVRSNWDPVHPSERPPKYVEQHPVFPYYRIAPDETAYDFVDPTTNDLDTVVDESFDPNSTEYEWPPAE